MEFFARQPPAFDFSHDEDNLAQFEWDPMTFDLSVNPEAPRDIPDNLMMDSIFTPDQVSALLAACDPSSLGDPFTADFSAECLNQALWDLPQFPETTIPSVQDPNPNPFPPPPPLEPIGAGSTTYRNGFGDPIQPLDYHRPYDLPANWEVNSTTSTLPSGVQSPSDSYAAYNTYPLNQLTPDVPNPNGPFSLMGSSTYSPCQYSASSDVGSVGNFSEKPIKKHRCQICGRAFQRQTTLTQHQITHTGERPYACPVAGCDKAFTTASNAKRHAKIHFRVSHGYHHISSSPGPF